MSEADIKRLFTEIATVYPSFEKNIGNLRTAQAWHQRLMGMTEASALRVLENHIASEFGDRAPTLNTFVKAMTTKVDAFVDDRVGRYKLVKGVLYWCVDGEEYETGNPDEEPYYVNPMGYICREHNGMEMVIGR